MFNISRDLRTKRLKKGDGRRERQMKCFNKIHMGANI